MKTARLSLIATVVILGWVEVRAQTPTDSGQKDTPPATPAAGGEVGRPVPVSSLPGFSDWERRYTNREITAVEFQKVLERMERGANPGRPPKKAPPPAVAAGSSAGEAKPSAASSTPHEIVDPPTPPSPPPPPPPAPAVEKPKAPVVETKVPEAETKAPAAPAPSPAAPAPAPPPKLSKRERLDALLKLVVEGKMTDEEYKKRRAEIAQEPDE